MYFMCWRGTAGPRFGVVMGVFGVKSQVCHNFCLTTSRKHKFQNAGRGRRRPRRVYPPSGYALPTTMHGEVWTIGVARCCI